MRWAFWIVQAIILAAAAVNIWTTDLVHKGAATARDAPNFIVCFVMAFLLWSNWRQQVAREKMVADARADYQKMVDEWAREDAEREARWAAQDAALEAEERKPST